ncbi:MAG TPA: PCYCGC motif-containing (lipo)protein [Gemmatimonadales bacterium]|nr:PCYCGC motif-containing (lipo)protein [Gemmatimonadales bacterium]
MPTGTSRRAFLGQAFALVPVLAFLPRRRGPQHPTPRPGITAAKVLTAAQLGSTPHAIEYFDLVRQIPEVVDGIRCQCGCAELEGFYSLLSCYEDGGMASYCEICEGEGRMAFRLHKEGKSLDEIRASIDARYG